MYAKFAAKFSQALPLAVHYLTDSYLTCVVPIKHTADYLLELLAPVHGKNTTPPPIRDDPARPVGCDSWDVSFS